MNRLIKDIISNDILVAEATDSISSVARKMKDNDLGFMPVVDNGTPVGVVTDRDITIRGYAERIAESSPISEVMTRNIISIDKNATADEALKVMSDNQIRRLCVIEDGRITGIVAIGDLAVKPAFIRESGEALSEISQ